ncbi:MAG TPA: hypothetical protein PLK12_14475 [Prolixibacteraceae bacterium]|nr:hypothetical protein [Prolixibacteraceae bacterium]
MASNFLSNFASAKKIFRREVIRHFQKSAGTGHEILTEEHLDQLPVPVARYLRYGGWVGKEIPKNFYVSLYGDFSLKPGKYMKVKVEQYSWLEIRNKRAG